MDHHSRPTANARQRLMQSILDAGNKAFNPDASEHVRAQGQNEFEQLMQRTKTLNLVGALSILTRPGHAPSWLRSKLVERLTLLPLRPDGTRATLEFVFAVHPSSTIRLSEAAVPQKKGANITHEALAMASNLLSVPPASVTPETWYSGISSQLLELLDGREGPELTKAASYIIGFGILGRKTSGAPGTTGWKYLAEPMLQSIRPPPDDKALSSGDDMDVIIDLTSDQVLVSPTRLTIALRRLHSLVVSHPNPGLCKRLLAPLLLPLWALSCWQTEKSPTWKPSNLAAELLNIYLKLSPPPPVFLTLVHNLGYLGGYDRQKPEWVYAETKGGELQIIKTRGIASIHQPSLDHISQRIPILLDLIISSFSDADISTAFIGLFGRWLKSARQSQPGQVLLQELPKTEDPLAQLTEVKLLQTMMDKFPDKLASQPEHILELVSQVLADSQAAPEIDDETIGVALSLLNMIATTPGFQRSQVGPNVFKYIESSLERLSRCDNPEVSTTASNLSLLLRFREEIDPSDSTAAPIDRRIEDRKTYNLAISYISQSDNPPPVRSEGLHLLSNLIKSQSPILDIPGILVLLSSLMSDNEDYINLQVIKLYTLLVSKHPKAVSKEILDHYIDANEKATVDARLRFGEALLQVIERLGEAFTGDVAQQVGDALVSVASRRGYRPKTKARQEREGRARQLKKKEAEEAWGGELPEFSDDETEEERGQNEILTRIVEGWESKRGMEDVRIRASALSILGNAMETNVVGLGARLVSTAVDLAVNILKLEREDEKGILRRAAVLLVLSFVKALEAARQVGKTLGFGLAARDDIMRTLGFVAETDGDGLVRQHARDAIESLDNWQLTRLMADAVEEPTGLVLGATPGLTGVTGLTMSLDRLVAGSGKARPRIEEVE